MLTVDDGPLLQIFASVVRQGSFSSAALSLHVSKSVVSERVAQLEARCGVRLLERTTRRIRLTEAGREVLEAAGRLDETLRQLSNTLEAGQKEPSGTLRIATTHDLGPLLLAPTTARFVRAYPKVRVELTTDDARQDLLESRIDLAVRMGEPSNTSFIMRRLGVLEEPVVAAPSLLASLNGSPGQGSPEKGPSFSLPHSPKELSELPWVCHRLFAGRTFSFEGPNGGHDEVSPQVRVLADTGATLLSLLLSGAGIGVLPEHALFEHLREGRLINLCPGWIWKRVTLYTLTPSKAFQRPAVKAFLNMLAEQVTLEPGRWGRPG